MLKKKNLHMVMLVTLLFFLILNPTQVVGIDFHSVPVPNEAMAADVSSPDHIIGTGTPESCTADAFIAAVAQGGTIVFNGGNKPFTITLDKPAKVFNNQNPDVVIDGGGLVTLSGGGKTRILYMNTCDPDQVWTTDHAQNQDHPRLVVQNLTFADGNSSSDTEYDGGGAIWVRGGRFRVVNCTFIRNKCASLGPDVGGGAIRVFDQYEDLPVYVVNSTFGGSEGNGNVGSNGGAISSIGVSWTLINCEFSYNRAIGNGGNPQKSGTPGGGSGGAIYNDGNQMTLRILGTRIEHNEVIQHGSAIFFVTNNHTGDIEIQHSLIANNEGGSWYPVYPGISMHADTKTTVIESIIEKTYEEKAPPNTAEVLVDGQSIPFEAYTIEGNNYFKLRDIAMALNGTSRQFNVTWDTNAKTVVITSNARYTPAGGELAVTISESKPFRKSTYPVLLDHTPLNISASVIAQQNYVKLRDIGEALDFDVSWDDAARKILIDTSKGYTDD